MALEYKALVLDLLSKHKYPVLQKFVVMDIYYKMIPVDSSSHVVHSFDRRTHDPMHELIQHSSPYHLSYLVGNEHQCQVHEMDQLLTDTLPIECQRIKLSRSYVDALRNETSETFEEELYHFITLLNFNLPQLAPLLGFNLMECTRLLPQFLRLWVYDYDSVPVSRVPIPPDLRSCFGPPECCSVFPIRVLRGHLAPCTSRSILLSLNNDLSTHLSPPPYVWHYSDRIKTMLPLAYNPLENPLIV
ncbi:uncharacterized protein TNCT_391101 [Trichonephila clavata]|uniref:Uncharacterized protein n=1 Tax=Trichonephila clavata TaxID=2740835 RepID=A0A8X6M4J5_TRICU|nr:uncharacterized protein TNCT_391101 [Trichonephila clavata]